MASDKDNQWLFQRWRELLAERLDEAVADLGSVMGVRGLVVGGSIGRGEPWPASDIDIFPIVAAGSDTDAEIERRSLSLVDWWAASARAQTLDVSRGFTDEEVEQAINSGAAGAASKMSDRRWFHRIDKFYGGYGVADPDGLAQAFAKWVQAVRFDPMVVSARVEQCWAWVEDARNRAVNAMSSDDRVAATLALRGASGALGLALVEGWGERLGSMGRGWTLFERMAKVHHAEDLVSRFAILADARPEDALERMKGAPAWLRERIDLTLAARWEVGEDVTVEENARDQIVAFEIHVTRRQPRPWGDWIRIPAPSLESKLAELDDLISTVRRQG